MPQFPEPLASIFVVLFGLVVGSFLNVCIYRLPVGQSIVHPRSRCPKCETRIAWYHNVPVISWILLRGKCASCSAPISWRYAFVEILSGATVLGFWRMFGPGVEFPIASAFALAMIVLFFTDFDHQLLPDAVTLTGLGVGIAVAWFNPFLNVPEPGLKRIWLSLVGAALGSGLLWGVGALYSKLRGVEAMGMGDVKMMAMVGAFTGHVGVLFTIFGASVAGAVVGIALIPMRDGSMQDKLPFGCFLAPAAVVALLYAQQAADAYLQFVRSGL